MQQGREEEVVLMQEGRVVEMLMQEEVGEINTKEWLATQEPELKQKVMSSFTQVFPCSHRWVMVSLFVTISHLAKEEIKSTREHLNGIKKLAALVGAPNDKSEGTIWQCYLVSNCQINA